MYGCQVAGQDAGQEFVEQLAEYTKLDIAASVNITCQSDLTGDWKLEYQTGRIETSVLFSSGFIDSYKYTLARFEVTNISDNGPGSLRQAVADAGFNGDTIVFTISNDTIRLSSGPLFIFNPLVIQGPGADLLSISAGYSSRIFEISEGVNPVEISGLSINHGQALSSNGGAIINYGNLVLINCTIGHNQAVGDNGGLNGGGFGGAIENNSLLTLQGCSVINNTARGGGGGSPDTTGFNGAAGGGGGGGGGFGGAIYNQSAGELLLINTTISGNVARGGDGGRGFENGGRTSGTGANGGGAGGTGGAAGSPGNSGGNGGGGGGGGGNTSAGGAGGSGGFGGGGGGGGASTSGGTGGSGGSGGFRGGAGGQETGSGAAGGGGGAGIGGAIFNDGGIITIRNSTIYANRCLGGLGGSSAFGTGNGFPGSSISGGIFNNSGTVVDLQNTIVAGNTGNTDNDVSGIFASTGFNLVGIVTGGSGFRGDDTTGTNVAPLSPRLAPLARYGGSTLTHALLVNSPAVDNGNNSNAPLSDQRGEARILDGNRDNISIIDIGAYEAKPPNAPSGLYTVTGNSQMELNWQANKELNIARFRIYRDTTSTAAQFIGQVLFINPGDTSFTDTGLRNGKVYYYRITAVDSLGFESYYSAEVTGRPNGAPVLTALQDTTVFTYTNFIRQVEALDLEGDALKYKDNSSLFDVDSLSGVIQFRPVLSDTGKHIITISVSDYISTTVDSFMLDIIPTPAIAADSLAITPQDQALVLRWYNPVDVFYKGTVVRMNDSEPVTTANPGQVVLDTTVSTAVSNSYRLTGLEIAKLYYFGIINYFEEDTVRIFSTVLRGNAETLAPFTKIDSTDREYTVVVKTRLDTSVVIKNSGGGTLLARFRYQPTFIQSLWFEMDSSLFTIPPGDSTSIPVSIHPTPVLPDITHSIDVFLITNQPGWIPRKLTFTMNPIFDKFAPVVQIKAQPDSIIKQGAVLFLYSADDTANAPIGEATDQLWSRYVCTELTSGQDIAVKDSLHTDRIVLYPLKDGRYEFKLWVYDNRLNGAILPAHTRRFEVEASRRLLPGRRWFLISFPRDTTIFWARSDSTGGILRWNTATEKYELLNNTDLLPGCGYWVFSTTLADIDLRKMALTSRTEPVSLSIYRGWNQIGVPMVYQIGWNEAKLMVNDISEGTEKNLIDAVKAGWIDPAVYWYASETRLQGYEWGLVDTTYGIPWKGYWLYSNVDGILSYPQQPAFREIIAVDTPPLNNVFHKNGVVWETNLALSTADYIDGKNIVGISNQTGLRFLEPPPLSEYAVLFFNSVNEKLAGDYREPFLSATDAKKWQVYIETTVPGQNHHLEWQLPSGNNVYFYLVDQKSGLVINMCEQNSYDLVPAAKLTSFTLFATMDANFWPKLIPTEFLLAQNFPNPFNPQTTIRFGIPENGAGKKTVLKIYNLLGQQVITLVNGSLEAGYFELVWNGRDAEERPVASGVYFYALKNGDHNLVRKMVLIR